MSASNGISDNSGNAQSLGASSPPQVKKTEKTIQQEKINALAKQGETLAAPTASPSTESLSQGASKLETLSKMGKISPKNSRNMAASSSSVAAEQQLIRPELMGVREKWLAYTRTGEEPMLIIKKRADGKVDLECTSKSGLISRDHDPEKVGKGAYKKGDTTYITDKKEVARDLETLNLTSEELREIEPFTNLLGNVRPSLKELSSRWEGYEKNNLRPMLFVKKYKDGRVEVNLKTAAAIIQDHDPKDIERGSCKKGDVTYIFDTVNVAKELTKLKLTEEEKFELKPFVSKLKAFIGTKQEKDHWWTRAIDTYSGKSTQEINSIIEVLTTKVFKPFKGSVEGFVGGTYPNAKVGVNVCDHMRVEPSLGFACIFDGVGHDDPNVVKDQIPIYDAIIDHFVNFVKNFDFTVAGSEGKFREEARSFDEGYQKAFNVLKSNYEEEGTAKGKQFAIYSEKISSNVQNKTPFTRSDFTAFRELTDIDRVKGALEKFKIERDAGRVNESEINGINLLEGLVENNPDLFISALERSSVTDYKLLSPYIRVDTKHFGGPAALFAQVFTTPVGTFLYTSQYADCCYLVIKPDGQYEWTKENNNSLGMVSAGKSYERTALENMIPLELGSIVFGFSDGIGEFLTKEEIQTILSNHLNDGADVVQSKIKEAIAAHPKIDYEDKEDVSRQRASNPKRDCKKFDPAGVDVMCVDDISFFILKTDKPTTLGSPKNSPRTLEQPVASSSSAASSSVP